MKIVKWMLVVLTPVGVALAAFTLYGYGYGWQTATDSPALLSRPPLPVREAQVNTKPLHLPINRPRIVVSKSERRLRLYAGQTLVRVYPVALGFQPTGDKERQGDGRTPEGTFYLYTKNRQSKFYLSLGISYPSPRHAQSGLRAKRITSAQYNAIISANRRMAGPPQNTPLGGDIFIHGRGATNDWTWGCVALENTDVKELFATVPVGTPVEIRP